MTSWNDDLYYIHNDYGNYTFKKLDIGTGAITDETSLPLESGYQYTLGHIDEAGNMQLLKMNASENDKLLSLYTYSLVNHTLTTIQEDIGILFQYPYSYIKDFLVLDNGNILMDTGYDGTILIDSNGNILRQFGYSGEERVFTILPGNNGFILGETASTWNSNNSTYSSVTPVTFSLYNNDGYVIRTVYTGISPSKFISATTDGSRNTLFTDNRHLYNIDPDGNTTERHLIGNGD